MGIRSKSQHGGVEAELANVLKVYGLEASTRSIVELFREALDLVVIGRSAPAGPQLSAADARELRAAGLEVDESRGAYNRVASSTMAKMAAILTDALSVGDVALRLGRTPARIRQMLNAREPSLYGIKLSEGDWRIPRFQFVDDGPPANLQPVLAVLPRDVHPIEFYNWFTAPDPALQIGDESVSPRDWLATGGNPQPVAAEAAQL